MERNGSDGLGQCEARTISSIHAGGRCSRKATVEVDGSRLCAQHAKNSPLVAWDLYVPRTPALPGTEA